MKSLEKSPPRRPAGCVYQRILPVCALLGSLSYGVIPAIAQQVVTIPNTATATYGPPGPNPPQRTTSNQTQVTATVGQASLSILKTADRASAEPGDTVVYRLQVRNTGTATVANVRVNDRLPRGFKLIERSVRASIGGQPVALNEVDVGQDGRRVIFGNPALPPQQTLTIVYAAVLTPDALRGSGRNVAVAEGNGGTVNSGSASYRVQIRPGILSDCGTLIGRVFVDKNFDGEQQPGEPGVPNAVIFMDDGNRITTDENGLFSLAFVVAGARTGTLDLTSLPGYTIAPNLYRIEGNSTARLVKLSPGGMGRMNFAVTPTYKEGQR